MDKIKDNDDINNIPKQNKENVTDVTDVTLSVTAQRDFNLKPQLILKK